MRRLFSVVKLEKINFFLFGIAVLAIVYNFSLSITHSSPFRMERATSTKMVFYRESREKDQDFSQAEPNSEYIDFKHHHTVQSGDTFIRILTNMGIHPLEAHAISKEISRIYSVKTLSIGQNISFLLSANDGSRVKVGDKPHNMSIHIGNKIIDGIYDQKNSPYSLKLLNQTISNKSKLVQGFVKDSLYSSAIKAGASPAIVMDYMKLLEHEVNFKNDIRANSEFQILFDYSENSHGEKISDGNVLYARLSLGNRRFEVYQYKDKNGKIMYFHSDGKNLKKALLQSPIQQARISSGFGVRVHPILKCRKMHKGIDYSAKRGTPILSAGDGMVQLAQYGSGYGKYVNIKHNNEYTTLYAHMSKLKLGIKKGTRVKQGQIIGYVGSTGGATGAHLHYEVRKYGNPINPIKVNPHIHNPLEGQRLVAFKSQKKKIDKMMHEKSVIILAKGHTSKK